MLWSVKLEGSVKSPMMYAYSDSTSPTPATDGTYVYFFNSSGEMGAWDFTGKEIWRRKYMPWGEPYPFNKQHEPILFGDTILNVEPLDGNPPEKRGWNYLRGIDKRTGKTLWIAEDGTTTYTTSVFGKMQDGKPAVLTARGGWHDVPERPVGLSLLSLSPGEEGQDDVAIHRVRLTRWQAAGRTGIARRAYLAGALHHALGPAIRLLVQAQPRGIASGDRQPIPASCCANSR